MRTIVTHLKQTEDIAVEANKRSKISCVPLQERDETEGLHFLSLAGLDTNSSRGGEPERGDGPVNAQSFAALQAKVQEIDRSVANFTNMLGAIKKPTSAENMVVEMGNQLFKSEGDMRAWIEAHLPPSQPFGVFVDTYVVLEMMLL
eukprot:1526487-Ditylum_brightwellii.AAC.1